MGTSTITSNTKPDQIEHIKQKDALTTSAKMGIRVTGIILKNKEGEVIERMVKQHGKVQENDIGPLVQRFLKKFDSEELYVEALNFYIQKLEEMLIFFEKMNSRRIIGSSVLMMLDKTNNTYDLRLIDLATIEDSENLDERDEGFILGIQNILKILKEIKK